jgi:pullulanase
MYESFGFTRSASGEQSIRLFIPDNTIDPSQYTGGDVSHIASVSIIGDFQHLVTAGAPDWDQAGALPMTQTAHPNGHLFVYAFNPPLPDGWYQYQYVVSFEEGAVRVVGDPCTKYGGDSLDRSAFVVGGLPADTRPIETRLASGNLIVYELMIDDFTKEFRGSRAPIDAIADKLDQVQALNINAIEFMPWIAWPDDVGFSWGYNPAYYFSVESAYVSDGTAPLNRLSRLAALINECHKRKIHVLLDIVLQHVYQGSGTNGFPYYWLWQTPTNSPFAGQFVPANAYGMLPVNYNNHCTQQFVTDVCTYWIERFHLDGFRFDQVTGYHNPQYPTKGAPALIAALESYAAKHKLENLSLILEDSWGLDVVGDANSMQPTGAWFDVFRSSPLDVFSGYAVKGAIDTGYMRVLNSALGFNAPICPTIYLENHDHATITYELGSRDRWFKAQPYMIALATCSGTVLLHNGQEWGQLEDLWEDDSNAPPQFKRVQSRPLAWEQRSDAAGQPLVALYSLLMGLRSAHPALRSPNFYPDYYDPSWTQFSPDGYGISESQQVAIYHRWKGADLYTIVLNFSDSAQTVNVPLPQNGTWTDLLNSNATYEAANYLLASFPVQSNWGCILHLGS